MTADDPRALLSPGARAFLVENEAKLAPKLARFHADPTKAVDAYLRARLAAHADDADPQKRLSEDVLSLATLLHLY